MGFSACTLCSLCSGLSEHFYFFRPSVGISGGSGTFGIKWKHTSVILPVHPKNSNNLGSRTEWISKQDLLHSRNGRHSTNTLRCQCRSNHVFSGFCGCSACWFFHPHLAISCCFCWCLGLFGDSGRSSSTMLRLLNRNGSSIRQTRCSFEHASLTLWTPPTLNRPGAWPRLPKLSIPRSGWRNRGPLPSADGRRRAPRTNSTIGELVN